MAAAVGELGRGDQGRCLRLSMSERLLRRSGRRCQTRVICPPIGWVVREGSAVEPGRFMARRQVFGVDSGGLMMIARQQGRAGGPHAAAPG